MVLFVFAKFVDYILKNPEIFLIFHSTIELFFLQEKI